ncbi:MAG: hypothetical protein QCI82_05300 [Candidatus Thermoplasmatota archaeon]|nr:hypothetical protein [Candidatus Thermoplasmatota archaeon]
MDSSSYDLSKVMGISDPGITEVSRPPHKVSRILYRGLIVFTLALGILVLIETIVLLDISLYPMMLSGLYPLMGITLVVMILCLMGVSVFILFKMHELTHALGEIDRWHFRIARWISYAGALILISGPFMTYHLDSEHIFLVTMMGPALFLLGIGLQLQFIRRGVGLWIGIGLNLMILYFLSFCLLIMEEETIVIAVFLIAPYFHLVSGLMLLQSSWDIDGSLWDRREDDGEK